MFKDLFGKFKAKQHAEINYTEPWKDSGDDLTCAHIKEALAKSYDVKFREILIGNNPNLPITLIAIEGLVDKEQISDYILKPLVQEERFCRVGNLQEAYTLIENGMIYFADQETVENMNDLIDKLLAGHSALVFDKLKKAVMFSTKGYATRAITEPSSENVTKGPKDSFVETLKVNSASIRRKIKSPHLMFEAITIGKQTDTPVLLTYMSNIANDNLVDSVRKKLKDIHTDSVLSTAILEEKLSGDIQTLFPQVRVTERPDVFCADILEGRVGIIIDGLPVTMIVPGSFVQYMQAPEDYSRNYVISSIIRIMRYALLIATLTLPAFYIAITTFHPELIPTDLVISIAEAKLGVPFPTPVETMIMLIAFEVIFEAGLRMPQNIGGTVTIVGALIVGDAAVKAHFLSAPVVIIIAFTAVASYAMPNQDLSNALRLWRLILSVCATVLGLLGMVIGLLLLLRNLCRIENFGVPYLSPLVTVKSDVVEDTIFRMPMRSMRRRPEELHTKNKIR